MFGKKAQENQINTKENTPMIENVVTVYLLGRLETYTRGRILMMLGTGMGKCTGVMGVVIRGTGKRGYSMDRVQSIFDLG